MFQFHSYWFQYLNEDKYQYMYHNPSIIIIVYNIGDYFNWSINNLTAVGGWGVATCVPWSRAATLQSPVDDTTNDDIWDELPEAEPSPPDWLHHQSIRECHILADFSMVGLQLCFHLWICSIVTWSKYILLHHHNNMKLSVYYTSLSLNNLSNV